MAATTAAPQALGDTFKRPLYSNEMSQWMGRAPGNDKERFQKVFQNMRSLSDSQRAEDVDAAFVQSTITKTKRASSARASHTPGKGSWSYTATRSAIDRSGGIMPGTVITLEPPPANSTAVAPAAPTPPLPPRRPASARPSGNPAAALRDRELAALEAAAALRRNSAQAAEPAQGPPAAQIETTYAGSYNLRNNYPELYDRALQDTKADPVPNYTLISEWGDSLRAGADQAHRLHLKSTYNAVNDEVVQRTTEFDRVKEREYYKWMTKQKTYYGDLLADDKRNDMEAILANGSDEERRDALLALRQTHAVVDPDQYRSHSQAVHCPMARTEDDKVTALLRESALARTMGVSKPPADFVKRMQEKREAIAAARRPHSAAPARPGTAELRPSRVEVTFQGVKDRSTPTRRPATAGPTVGGAWRSAAPPKQRTGLERDTFRSKVPLKWATGSTGEPLMSTYLDTYGGAKVGNGRQRPSSALLHQEQIKYREVTCPFGAVNPHTAMAPARTAYPVPEGFLARPAFPQSQDNVTMGTTYRETFAPRDEECVKRSLRATADAIEVSHKALQRSTLPLGKGGFNIGTEADWISEMKDEYVPQHMDVRADYERAQALKAIWTGPTASVGKVATIVEPRFRVAP